MNLQSKFVGMGLLTVVFVLAGFSATKAQDSEYSFKVVNKTNMRIVKILVAESGQKYKPFDIGAGIGPGKTVTLVWSSETDSESCIQWVKAVYADKTESTPAKFDFCEEDLVLEFTE
ncbi:MAG: hypothetical protein UZ17_ACD001001378 [Acidobacteria bacterium OLB17]|nr:MAG: hypothetical protein UZ17_ACD001001378 [Acidobacteria bacterium OLB17]MCZ2391766.1 hypothetical protein [Acidobacteriota bacterium]